MLLFGNKSFVPFAYTYEKDFEREVVAHCRTIFGPESLYIDVKHRIGESIVTIPDGYLIDFAVPTDPRLYIIENELATHDAYKHIGQQLLKFAISYRVSGRRIKKYLLDAILADDEKLAFVNGRIEAAGFRNIDDFLESVILDRQPAAIVVIDEVTTELEEVLKQLAMTIDIVEFQTFTCGQERAFRVTPFQQEIRALSEAENAKKVAPNELNTVVVPANEEGFTEVFLGQNCWYSIRMSSMMTDLVKYIAAYQTSPVSAITHYAEVARIEKYEDTGKYILYFSGPAKEIGPITLPKNKKGIAPQAPRYTSFRRLVEAKTLNDLF